MITYKLFIVAAAVVTCALALDAPLRGRSGHRQSTVVRVSEPIGLANPVTTITDVKDLHKNHMDKMADKFREHFSPFLGRRSRSWKEREVSLKPFAYPPYYNTQVNPAPRGTDAVELVASPASLEIGQDVTVTYSGVQPQSGDFIAIYCPPNPKNGPGDYLDTASLNQSGDPPSAVVFSDLMNMRCDYQFSYISNSSGSLTVLGTSNVVKMAAGPNVPLQGHISLITDTSYAVTWNSGANTPSRVDYGLSAAALTSTAAAQSWTYAADAMCGAPANTTAQMYYRDPGFFHSATLGDLALSTTYYYRYGNDNDGWSEIRSFHTPPPTTGASTANVTTRFLAYADMGIDPSPRGMTTATRALTEIENGYDDFLIHFGDISYARGAAYVWDAFFDVIEPVATRVPYMVSVGNHEYDHEEGGEKDPSKAPGNGWHPSWGNLGDDSSGECGVPTYQRFVMPRNGNDLFWYSFNYGNVHVIQLSTEHDWTPGAPQYNWLENDLASVNRTTQPWIILTGHRPMYSSETDENNDYTISLYMRQALEEMIYKYKVNMMMTGHYHSYERSCPIYQGKCQENDQGTVHVVVGTAGAGLEGGKFTAPWSASHLNYWGYSRLEATSEYLKMDFVRNDDGSVYDTIQVKPWK